MHMTDKVLGIHDILFGEKFFLNDFTNCCIILVVSSDFSDPFSGSGTQSQQEVPLESLIDLFRYLITFGTDVDRLVVILASLLSFPTINWSHD